MGVLGRYTNGNYNVILFEDGTKIRFNKEDHFSPQYPESMDIKITNQCDRNCPFCHEDSTPDGCHGDIMNAKFINTLHPYTELAIGGGNPLTHPQLRPFLEKCKDLKLVPSMTVNQIHFMKDFDYIKELCDNRLVYGLGVSLVDINDEFIDKISQIPNAVIHVIAGTIGIKSLRKLGNKNLKILILGYKHFRRGEKYFKDHRANVSHKIRSLRTNIKEVFDLFKVVSFDNLAIKQLNLRKIMTEDEWNKFYMGDDGQFTMYIDMVNNQFATSSTSTRRYALRSTIKSMFEVIQHEKEKTA